MNKQKKETTNLIFGFHIELFPTRRKKRMSIKHYLVLTAILLVLSGCSKSAKEEGKAATPANTTMPQKLKKADKPIDTTLSRIFSTTKFNSQTWSNGIHIQKKNMFFITISNNLSDPIKIGYRLKFAAAGEVEVTEVSRLDYPTYSSLFVCVSKNLDPIADGNPNLITLLGFKTSPCAYSGGNVWKNGIHLQSPGTFFIAIAKKDTCPIKVGDRVIFNAAGESRVQEINRFESESSNSSIIIKVDKNINPTNDGAPNPIKIIFPN